MVMTPGLRKGVLTAHIACAVGSLGAVAGFLALAVYGLVGRRGAAPAVYPAMELATWSAIVPLLAAGFITGLIQSLGTPWGLLRHYWVLTKLLLTLLALVVLLIQTGPIGDVARAAEEASLSAGDFYELRLSLVVHAAGGLVVLLVANILSVYKPRGLTPCGQRAARPH